ncbi:hypothetical protein P168DRAFT_326111 [Aspergillus campestris IBT 28561]|uniref:Uncharacterized protein n=1 Tax=Aspergillus campestris (strain IBT 28561) TaxID=1392248 RepID=A0A2I1D7E0_ASPC2|nr:uncharacterized protein P168DRAFT_326111 [Aspergillus campestris IBT 28561]PKY05802.1 hypothetical protein P168DRAFT_326111 [Aspergillus campestris IBT 28561]
MKNFQDASDLVRDDLNSPGQKPGTPPPTYTIAGHVRIPNCPLTDSRAHPNPTTMRLSMKLSFLTIVAIVAPVMALPGDIHHRYRFFEMPASIALPASLSPVSTGTGPVRHADQTNYYHRVLLNATVPQPLPNGTAIGTAAPSPGRPPTTASRTSSSTSSTTCPSRVATLRPIVTGDMAAARKRWALRRGNPEGACPGTNPDDYRVELPFGPGEPAGGFPIGVGARAV